MALLEFRQREFDSVALNEELLFFFSKELDRASVTSDSFRILDERGQDVAGERIVRGNAVSFLPALPCASDLSDGALQPGATYRVILGGFPRPDGIRSEDGMLLSACLRMGFHTAEIRGTSPLFLDPFLGPFPLVPRGKRSRPIELEDGLLVLEYGEALDPSSVPSTHFELSRFPPGATRRELVPVIAELVENQRNLAVLALRPIGAGIGDSLPPDKYYLQMPGRDLRTLGGRAVEPGWAVLELSVPQTRIDVDFSSSRGRSSEPPAGCDGTAVAGEKGSGLTLRYPAAAGNGRDGMQDLREPPRDPDLQAVRLTIPGGAEVDLSPKTGPVVLRSQTSIVVRGRLVRSGAARRNDPLTIDFERAGRMPKSHWPPLTTWVEQLIASEQPWAGEPWTVLIAGGDISIPEGGAIQVEGPLVLVAGGWIRVDGVAVSMSDIWQTPEGGDGMVSHGKKRFLPLILDPPLVNPLRAGLCVGVLTSEIQWAPRKNGWSTSYFGREGIGKMSALFLQAAPGARARLLKDPSGLAAGSMRVLAKLEIGPGRGEAWDPPRLDHLRLEAVPGQPSPAPRN